MKLAMTFIVERVSKIIKFIEQEILNKKSAMIASILYKNNKKNDR